MFPRWLSWLIILLLAYAIMQGSRNASPVLPNAAPTRETQTAPTTPQETKLETKTLNEAMDMERWKRAINPDYAERVQCELKAQPGDASLLWKVTEDTAGSGAGARCGEALQVKLIVWNARGQSAYTGEMEFHLGAREVAAGLDAALVGIRKGGTRTVILGPGALTRDAKSTAAKPLLAAIGSNRVVIVTAERLE